jgi:hypothetical protein
MIDFGRSGSDIDFLRIFGIGKNGFDVFDTEP